jgi:hypothetical protein
MKTVLEIYFDWFNYYESVNAFCPYSEAEEMTVLEVMDMKKTWSKPRAVQFVRNLITR